MRLQKLLADRGVASRRASERLIAAGRVTVDGHVVRTLGARADPGARIEIDGRVVAAPPTHRYLMLNKPAGVLSTARDERGRTTVVSLVPPGPRLYPVGRLDADSEGLILLTNDGDWAEHVLHPRYGHEREYEVTATGAASAATIAQLRRGVKLEEGLARAVSVRLLSRTEGGARLRVVLQTGWKRQIRRMCAAVGLRVTRLARVRIGSVRLGRLAPGAWRELTPREVERLGGGGGAAVGGGGGVPLLLRRANRQGGGGGVSRAQRVPAGPRFGEGRTGSEAGGPRARETPRLRLHTSGSQRPERETPRLRPRAS